VRDSWSFSHRSRFSWANRPMPGHHSPPPAPVFAAMRDMIIDDSRWHEPTHHSGVKCTSSSSRSCDILGDITLSSQETSDHPAEQCDLTKKSCEETDSSTPLSSSSTEPDTDPLSWNRPPTPNPNAKPPAIILEENDADADDDDSSSDWDDDCWENEDLPDDSDWQAEFDQMMQEDQRNRQKRDSDILLSSSHTRCALLPSSGDSHVVWQCPERG